MTTPSPTTTRETLLVTDCPRMMQIALSLRGRWTRRLSGYLMRPSNARKAERLYAGGFVAFDGPHGWRYTRHGERLRLPEALALIPLDGKAVPATVAL